jgi:hypothetical protein
MCLMFVFKTVFNWLTTIHVSSWKVCLAILIPLEKIKTSVVNILGYKSEFLYLETTCSFILFYNNILSIDWYLFVRGIV